MDAQLVPLDWYGNPITCFDAPTSKQRNGLMFQGQIDPDGKPYVVAVRENGELGDRLAADDIYLCIEDKNGHVVYDSRLPPPPGAKLLPCYIGYWRKQTLKRQFPE